jgi:putative flippase GtrA
VLLKVLKKFDQQFRFLIVGGVNTVFGLSIYPLLYIATRKLGVSYLWLLVPSQILAISFSYATFKYFVYKTKGNHVREYGKFSFFHVVMFMLNLVVLPFFVEVCGINPMVSQVLFGLFVASISYFWYKKIAFKLQ